MAFVQNTAVAALAEVVEESGLRVEVVSEFELRAALKEGFAPENILVNGPAKHHWLPAFSCSRLKVNFDSAAEIRALIPQAKQLKWSCGIRLHTKQEFDPEAPQFPTQFGFTAKEALPAIKMLSGAVNLETVHFHLRTNVASASIYEQAIEETGNICRRANFQPKHIDCGGGFPAPHVTRKNNQRADAQFSTREMAQVLRKGLRLFPGCQQIWVENGRWLSAGSGVLVMKVLDTKDRPRLRQLICDGGRTLNAMISTWEDHELSMVPRRTGKTKLTSVVGPTCMPFDQITRRALPKSIRAGDHLVWFEAGAYHLPWETRFSHGHPEVYWQEAKKILKVREAQAFQSWWGCWNDSAQFD